MDCSSWMLWAVDDEAAKVSKAVRDPNFIINSLILVATLILAAVLISWLQRWRKRQFEDDRPLDQFTSIRSMFEAGEISKEEYDQIKQRLANKVSSKSNPSRTAQSPPADSSKPIDLSDYE